MELKSNASFSFILSDILDNVVFRIFFSILILLPLSLVLFICAILILAFPNKWMLLLSFTGFIGIIGAWLRIIISNKKMSSNLRMIVKSLLIIGLLTSLSFFLTIIFSYGFKEIFYIFNLIIFFIPTLFGIFIFIGTLELDDLKYLESTELHID